MKVPEELSYTKEHEWVRVTDDESTIGITDFAQQELGDIVYIEIETVGDNLQKEQVFGTVEAVKTVSDLFMPISGKVESFNEDLEQNPQLINQDPYERGWIIKITDFDKSSLDNLLSSEEYKQQLGL